MGGIIVSFVIHLHKCDRATPWGGVFPLSKLSLPWLESYLRGIGRPSLLHKHMNAHTHTHTHASTNARMHAAARMHARTHARSHARTQTNINKHKRTSRTHCWLNPFLSYAVPIPGVSQPKALLKKIDGFVKPYMLLALMGASGAGKTTLQVLSYSHKHTRTQERFAHTCTQHMHKHSTLAHTHA